MDCELQITQHKRFVSNDTHLLFASQKLLYAGDVRRHWQK